MSEMEIIHPQIRDRESRIRPEKITPDIARARGRDHDRHESPDADLVQQQLRREKHATDRRIKSRGDPRARAGRDQGRALPGWDAQPLPYARAKSRADLNDRSLAPDRAAAADRERGSERLDHRHDRPDHALIIIDRVHYFRHAVPARFGRKSLHQPGHAERAEHRHEDDEHAPRARRSVDVRLVKEGEFPEKKDVVEDRDHPAENDRAEAADETDHDCEEPKPERRERRFPAHARAGGPEAGRRGFRRLLNHGGKFPSAKIGRSAGSANRAAD